MTADEQSLAALECAADVNELVAENRMLVHEGTFKKIPQKHVHLYTKVNVLTPSLDIRIFEWSGEQKR